MKKMMIGKGGMMGGPGGQAMMMGQCMSTMEKRMQGMMDQQNMLMKK